MTTPPPLPRRLLAELLGPAFLAALVIGSGIAAQQLSPHQIGLELFEHAAATAVGLFAIILMFGPVSGGHFNPVASFVDAHFGGISHKDALAYLPAQITGCILGATTANLMFPLSAVRISTHHRASPAHFLSEIIATLGLIVIIFALATTRRSSITPAAVGAYIGAAYLFTSSTSFANPAITIGRMFSTPSPGSPPPPYPPSSSPRRSAAPSPSSPCGRSTPTSHPRTRRPSCSHTNATATIPPMRTSGSSPSDPDRRWAPSCSCASTTPGARR